VPPPLDQSAPPTKTPWKISLITLEGTTTYHIAKGEKVEYWWSYNAKELRPRCNMVPTPELLATR